MWLRKNVFPSNGCFLFPHLVVLVYENFNKQLYIVLCEMILRGEKTLEAIIQKEDEISVAIESLLETPVGNAEIETISPVIEQQIDPESYESTSYSIETEGY